MHLKPIVGCQMSTLIFEKNCGRGGLYKYPMNNSQNGKVLAHLGFNSNVFPGPLTDVSACVGFCTSSHSRVSNINFDI